MADKPWPWPNADDYPALCAGQQFAGFQTRELWGTTRHLSQATQNEDSPAFKKLIRLHPDLLTGEDAGHRLVHHPAVLNALLDYRDTLRQ